ncbi:ribosylnicotinamide kinase [Entomophthora muscae]|uniref:Ribosylnicotinamide kinase n=1 Tax=Entomophthora muscae TaxID=34485 RepID=A0ACC2U2E4_9FUNG|nr:ribosylnicotinamide kinase [Entomophthora muscae]
MMPEAPFKPSTENTLKTKVIGISGCSCSGKTTLASVIQLLLPKCAVIHQDEFYKLDSHIPKDPGTGYDNWDTPKAIDMDKFYDAIVAATSSEVIVKNKAPKDDTIKDAASWVLDNINSGSAKKVFDPSTRYIIVEGFLFFHDPKFLSLLDGAILAWADYPTLLERREARPGYETKEGNFGYFRRENLCNIQHPLNSI